MKISSKLMESLEGIAEDDIIKNTYETLVDIQNDIDYEIDNIDGNLEEADLDQLQMLYNSLDDVIALVKNMLPPDNSNSWKIPKDKVDPYWQKYI